MRVLYLLNGYGDGGAELGLLTLVENGFFEGHDLTVLALTKGSGSLSARLRQRLGPGRVLSLSEDRNLRSWRLPFLLLPLYRLLQRLDPDVAVLSLPQSNLLGRLAASGSPKTIIASFEHSQTYRRRATRFLMKLTASRVDFLLYDHPVTWRALEPVYAGVSPGRRLSVPLSVLETHPRPGSVAALRRLLVVGRLAPEKNHSELIQAIAVLRDRGYTLELSVLGDGPERRRLERLTSQLGLREQVRFCGFQEDVGPYLRAADFFVQPSRWEGLCRSVLEAMAESLLVVSTDVGGMADYGADLVNMIKSRGADRHALADALERALSLPPEQVLEIGARAASTVAEKFSVNAVRPVWLHALGALTAAAAERRSQSLERASRQPDRASRPGTEILS